MQDCRFRRHRRARRSRQVNRASRRPWPGLQIRRHLQESLLKRLAITSKHPIRIFRVSHDKPLSFWSPDAPCGRDPAIIRVINDQFELALATTSSKLNQSYLEDEDRISYARQFRSDCIRLLGLALDNGLFPLYDQISVEAEKCLAHMQRSISAPHDLLSKRLIDDVPLRYIASLHQQLSKNGLMRLLFEKETQVRRSVQSQATSLLQASAPAPAFALARAPASWPVPAPSAQLKDSEKKTSLAAGMKSLANGRQNETGVPPSAETPTYKLKHSVSSDMPGALSIIPTSGTLTMNEISDFFSNEKNFKLRDR
jgi:hypothetical protein